MPDADDDLTVAPLPPKAPPTAADLEPGTEAWRVNVAMYAHQFFSIVHDPEMAKAAGKSIPPADATTADGPPKTLPFDPWSVYDFSRYLGALGLRNANNAISLTNLLGSLERAGLLWLVGRDPQLPIMSERYVAPGQISKGQRSGNLWLSAVFGAGLIIPSYNAVTIQLAGHDDDGNPVDSWGTGLVVDHQHVITNKHVVAGLAGTSSGLSIYPSRNNPDAERVECRGKAVTHPTLDVAVIKFDMPDGKYIPRLAGMAFRDPDWADEVYVFGYPRVPMTADMAITVQRGEVVNPSVETIPDREKIFLYSAIARPGNSGGPIVAQDGRVIGLVVEDSSPSTRACASADEQSPPRELQEQINDLEWEVEELKAKAFAPSFYRGIPSGEVVRALDDLGFGGIIEIDGLG
jgi:S1-C subfamily serine protease